MKFSSSQYLHVCFNSYDAFKKKYNRSPKSWNMEDMKLFEEIALEKAKFYFEKVEEEE